MAFNRNLFLNQQPSSFLSFLENNIFLGFQEYVLNRIERFENINFVISTKILNNNTLINSNKYITNFDKGDLNIIRKPLFLDADDIWKAEDIITESDFVNKKK